jgi:hypothetical protein
MTEAVSVTETEAGFAIHIDRTAAAGFCSILLNAKFQPGLRWDVLLTPWIFSILEALGSAGSVSSEGISPAPDLQALIERVIDDYRASHQDPRPRDELVRQALYPIPPA